MPRSTGRRTYGRRPRTPWTRRLLRIIGWLAIVAALALIIYVVAIRPWQLRWGATAAEARAVMPGDELAPAPNQLSTRAITINTTPDKVWPWIVQLGYQRAGWYTYDWIDRILGAADFVDGHSSSKRIVPELQNLKVGDPIKLAPPIGYTVHTLEPNRLLILYGPPANGMVSTWVFQLGPTGSGGTRLIVRGRGSQSTFGNRAIMTLIEPGTFIMERGMLLGIKARAEGRIR